MLGYHLVLVLDQGRLVEQGELLTPVQPLTSLPAGPPGKLINSGGIFDSMAAAAGLKA